MVGRVCELARRRAVGQSISSGVRVGLDARKDSIDIALSEAGRDGEVRPVGSIGGDLVLPRWTRRCTN